MAKAPLAYLYQVVLAKVWQKQRCWDHSWSWQPGFMSSGKMKQSRRWPSSKRCGEFWDSAKGKSHSCDLQCPGAVSPPPDIYKAVEWKFL